jgi:hypothetical protein
MALLPYPGAGLCTEIRRTHAAHSRQCAGSGETPNKKRDESLEERTRKRERSGDRERGATRRGAALFFVFFCCESSLLRINQRHHGSHHGLRTRLWHTPPAAVKKPTEESDPRARSGGERGQGQSLWIDLCVPSAPPGTPRLGAPSLLLLPPLSPPDPTPSIRPTGRWRGTYGPLGFFSAFFFCERLVPRLPGSGRTVKADRSRSRVLSSVGFSLPLVVCTIA